MRSFIFITKEGYTYQNNSTSIEPDIENCQVIGFVDGLNEDDAYANLLDLNEYLRDTSFNEIICLELKNRDFLKNSKHFYLKK